jgi:hypothetical protein
MEQDMQSTGTLSLSENPELLAMALDELQARLISGKHSIDEIWEMVRSRYDEAAQIARS